MIRQISIACAQASLLVLTSAAVLAAPPLSIEARQLENFNPQGQLLPTMKDGEAFINSMYASADKLNDYSVSFEMRTFKKNSTIVESGRLFFKKPRQMRVEETGEFNKGSVAAIGKDGKAHAHRGGPARLLTLTIDPDDKLLDAANGDHMQETDFISLTKLLKGHLKRGARARVSDKPTKVNGVEKPVYILEVYKPTTPETNIKRIFIDPQSNLPIRWDDYDFAFPCLSRWNDFKTNTGLSDELFTKL